MPTSLIFMLQPYVLEGGFEDIQQLTSISYAIKKNNHWGIYRLDIRNFIIPLEYESIRFYGGHTVLVRKDGLWGAKDILLDEPSYKDYKVSIPTEYLEIEILDDDQRYFGCKENDEYDGLPCYTIINSNGEENGYWDYYTFNTQFEYYDSSHIMTSLGDKYGFISVDGYISIPFKYDEIRQRNDRRFDVRIEDRWGLLSLDGRDSFDIKLENPLPSKLDENIIIQDVESEYFGIIDPNGGIVIPAIYEHLFNSDDKELYYFAYDGNRNGNAVFHGWPVDNYNLYIKECSSLIKSGMINSKGICILSGKYKYFEMQDEYIIAGRDGNYNYWADSKFDGVYDLFNKQGELLIGGFREFLLDRKHDIFVFSFGGEWKGHQYYPMDGQEPSVEDYSVEYKGDDLWLILDKELKTIVRNENGEQKQFPKGFIGNVILKKEGNKEKCIYNLPLQYLVEGFDLSKYSNGIRISSIIIKHGKQALDIATGKMTKEFIQIDQITDKLFMFKDVNTVGITNIDSEILLGNCFLITRPVSNYFFIAKEKTEDVCSVYLYDINNIPEPITIAISEITKEKLVSIAEREHLLIKYNNNYSGLKSIV